MAGADRHAYLNLHAYTLPDKLSGHAKILTERQKINSTSDFENGSEKEAHVDVPLPRSRTRTSTGSYRNANEHSHKQSIERQQAGYGRTGSIIFARCITTTTYCVCCYLSLAKRASDQTQPAAPYSCLWSSNFFSLVLYTLLL